MTSETPQQLMTIETPTDHDNAFTEAEHAHRLAYALRAVLVSLEATGNLEKVSMNLRRLVLHTLSTYFRDDHSVLNDSTSKR